jgi:hypothetical protein
MELRNLRAILLKEWDPLEVGDNPNLFDEYELYLPGILSFVNAGHTSNEIAEYLKGIEESLEITLPAERRMTVARLLSGK